MSSLSTGGASPPRHDPPHNEKCAGREILALYARVVRLSEELSSALADTMGGMYPCVSRSGDGYTEESMKSATEHQRECRQCERSFSGRGCGPITVEPVKNINAAECERLTPLLPGLMSSSDERYVKLLHSTDTSEYKAFEGGSLPFLCVACVALQCALVGVHQCMRPTGGQFRASWCAH